VLGGGWFFFSLGDPEGATNMPETFGDNSKKGKLNQSEKGDS